MFKSSTSKGSLAFLISYFFVTSSYGGLELFNKDHLNNTLEISTYTASANKCNKDSDNNIDYFKLKHNAQEVLANTNNDEYICVVANYGWETFKVVLNNKYTCTFQIVDLGSHLTYNNNPPKARATVDCGYKGMCVDGKVYNSNRADCQIQ